MKQDFEMHTRQCHKMNNPYFTKKGVLLFTVLCTPGMHTVKKMISATLFFL